MYEQYYTQQQNGYGDFPVYIGAYRQRGHGIGNVLRSVFRRIIPTIKAAAPHVLRAGAEIFDDVSQGKSFKDAAFQRVPSTISKIVSGKNSQSGSGLRRRRRVKKRDIFS
jgi:hypothetical protein